MTSLPVDKQIAIALHELMCGWNHTDQCGWFVSKDDGDWSYYSRKDYLERARKLMAATKQTPEQILEIVRLAKGVS